MTNSALQAGTIRAQMLHGSASTNADALVEEYIQVKGLSAEYVDATDQQRLIEEAVQFIHLVLLRDLRPPWLEHNFPQALPGEGLLSRFTRPSLLYWRADEVINLFGNDVHCQLADAADAVDLVFAGVIARPLYKCTEVKDESTGEVCMNVASMSPFLQNTASRSAYRCRDCVAKAQGAQAAPGSASASLRCLWAYPMVQGVDGQPIPLRVGTKIRLLVHAPPATWGWGTTLPAELPTHAAAAEPEQQSAWYKYNTEESAAIWFASKDYQGTPPLLQ